MFHTVCSLLQARVGTIKVSERRRGASRGRVVRCFRGSGKCRTSQRGTEGDLPGVRRTRRRRNPPTNDNLEVQMKMVKSLLLGSAAGVVAVAGAQAADLPVKAVAVQYVKICTLYGDGFYYIPGSDTCIKFSGYIRADYGFNATGARTPHYSGAAGAQDRTVSRFSTRHRANLQIDTRTQTPYGTLRTFQSIHLQNENTVESTN